MCQPPRSACKLTYSERDTQESVWQQKVRERERDQYHTAVNSVTQEHFMVIFFFSGILLQNWLTPSAISWQVFLFSNSHSQKMPFFTRIKYAAFILTSVIQTSSIVPASAIYIHCTFPSLAHFNMLKLVLTHYHVSRVGWTVVKMLQQ